MPRRDRTGKTGASREPSDAVSESRRAGVAAPVWDHLGAIPARSPRLRLAGLDAHAAAKFYLSSYAASSLGESQPHNTTGLRWVLKTAPGRKAIHRALDICLSRP